MNEKELSNAINAWKKEWELRRRGQPLPVAPGFDDWEVEMTPVQENGEIIVEIKINGMPNGVDPRTGFAMFKMSRDAYVKDGRLMPLKFRLFTTVYE